MTFSYEIITNDLIKILLSVFLAGLIGYNRERSGMTIGIRTHILVCISAVLLQTISVEYAHSAGVNADAMRLGGQMLTGIGFLCTGAIIRDKRNVWGLTTSTSIFFVACLGLAIGSGFYAHATIMTLTAYIFLVDLFHLKGLVPHRKNYYMTVSVTIRGSYDDNVGLISGIMNSLNVDIYTIDRVVVSAEESNVLLNLRVQENHCMNDIVAALMDSKLIIRVEIIDN